MGLLFQGADGSVLTELRFETPESVSYKQINILNQGTDVTGLLLKCSEVGMGGSDASQLGNRAQLAMTYTLGTLKTGNLAIGPVSVFQNFDPTSLAFHVLDGMLQVSSDTFNWSDYLNIGALAGGDTVTCYARYQKTLMGAGTGIIPFITRVSVQNIGVSTITEITFTAQDTNTTLSLDGVTYSSSISIASIGAGSSVTIWVSSTDISSFPYAQLTATDAASDSLSIPFLVPGGRAYCSIQDIRDYLETIDIDVITTDEEILALIYEAANGIDRSTRRRFDQVGTTERYDGSGQQKLVLGNYPIIQILEVQIINPDNQVVTDIKSTDPNFSSELIIDPVYGFITLPSQSVPQLAIPVGTFYPPLTTYYPPPARGMPQDYIGHFGYGISNIVVTYIYGYQTPPEGIRAACKKLVTIELLRKKGTSDTQGAQTESIAGVTMTYSTRGGMGSSGGSGPYGHMIAELGADVKALLTQFRKRSWKIV